MCKLTKMLKLSKFNWHSSFLLIALMLTGTGSVDAQLTLQECQKLAHDHYPMIARTELISSTADYTVDNLSKGFLPQVSLNAQATYQNDATKINLDMGSLQINKGMNKGQYRAMVEVAQKVYDGGLIGNQKKLAEAQSKSQQQALEVNLYALNDRINQLFFGSLLLREQLEQNRIMTEDLERTSKQVASMNRFGVANESDQDAVGVELLKYKQNRCELESAQTAYLEMLSQFIGQKVNSADELVKPEQTLAASGENNRMELDLYRLQAKELDSQLALIKAKNRPMLGLFVDGGFGNPGYNMFKTGLQSMWMGGVRLSWNFGNLYTKRNEEKLIDVSKRNLEVEESTFRFNNQLQVVQEDQEITKLGKLASDDDEIVRLRESIGKAMEAKMANGTATVNDYLTELAKLDVARRNRASHDLQLLQAQYNRKYITNN